MKNRPEERQRRVDRCAETLDQHYWNKQWESGTTGWDIGYASPAITRYLQQYHDKDAAILIPGCGNAYEAQYLLDNDFTNVTLIDIAPKAVEVLRDKFGQKSAVKVVHEDLFQHEGNYDLIIEQTFLCAIPPSMRERYASKMASLLNANGRIIGVLFDRVFEQKGPPFGGHTSEYQLIFEPHFHIRTMDPCYNSIAPRANTEVFINLVKRGYE